jgi:hypothetical protein
MRDVDHMRSTRTYNLPMEYIEIELVDYLFPWQCCITNVKTNYLVLLIWAFPGLKEISFSETGEYPEKPRGQRNIEILHSDFRPHVGCSLFEDPKPLIVQRVGEPSVEFKSRYIWWFPVILGPEIGASSRILRISWLM